LKRIYVKLPNNTWVWIKGKIGSVKVGKSVRRATFTLIAESLENFEKPKRKPMKAFYISSTSVTKYIYRLVDAALTDDTVIVVEYISPEVYRVEVYGQGFEEVYKIAEEAGIVRKPKLKSGEESS